MIGISKVFKLIIAIVLLAFLMACSKDEDPTRVLIANEINIDGDWKTACGYDPEEDAGGILSINFSDNNFTYTLHEYSDSSCSQLKNSGTISGKITHHGTESIRTPSGKTAYEKDLTFENNVKWKSLVALEDDDNTLYLAPGVGGAERPDDINEDTAIKLSKGTVPPPIKHVDIDGAWKTDCIYLEEDKVGLDFVFKVSGNSFSFRINAYSDNSCTQSKDSKLDSGKITYGEEVTTSSGSTAHEIDLRYEDGEVWESLVAKQGSKLILNPDLEGTGRPDDFDRGFLFSEQ